MAFVYPKGVVAMAAITLHEIQEIDQDIVDWMEEYKKILYALYVSVEIMML